MERSRAKTANSTMSTEQAAADPLRASDPGSDRPISATEATKALADRKMDPAGEIGPGRWKAARRTDGLRSTERSSIEPKGVAGFTATANRTRKLGSNAANASRSGGHRGLPAAAARTSSSLSRRNSSRASRPQSRSAAEILAAPQDANWETTPATPSAEVKDRCSLGVPLAANTAAAAEEILPAAATAADLPLSPLQIFASTCRSRCNFVVVTHRR